MPSYYLKIPTTIQYWFPGGAPADWRTRAFDDATEKGTRLTYHALRPNAEGARLALYGDEFYFEVGRDRERADTLFLTRIEAPHELTVVPKSLVADIRTWPGAGAPLLDRVDALFGDADATESPEQGEVAAPFVEPSHLLLAVLRELPQDVRERLRPRADIPDARALLEPLRAMWARFRLDRMTSPGDRQTAVLRGVVQPAALDSQEADGLMALFGFHLLNRVIAGGGEARGEVERLVRALGDVPDTPTRLSLWAASIDGMAGPTLRREIFNCRAGLMAIGLVEDQRTNRACSEFVLPTLLSAARDARDAALVGVIQQGPPGVQVLCAVADWADSLDFSGEATREVSAPVVASPPVDDSRARLLDRWVLRLRGLGSEQVRAQSIRIRDVVKRAETAVAEAESVAGLASLLVLIDQLRTDAGAWLQGLPDPKDLASDRHEADVALRAAEDKLGPDALELVEESTSLTPNELLEIAALLGDIETLQAVPEWLWNIEGGESRGGPVTGIEMARQLARQVVRSAIGTFVDCLKALGQPAAARWLPPLPPGRSVEEHLLEWKEKALEFLVDVSPEIQQILRSTDGEGADLNVLLSNVARVTRLREGIGNAVTAELMEAHAGVPAATLAEELDALIRAVDFIRKSFGDLSLNAEMIRRRVEREKGDRPAFAAAVAVEAQIGIDHNWTDVNNAKATLTLRPAADGAAYGVLAAPLVLHSAQPSATTVEIGWQVKGKLRDTWPEEWPPIEPSGPVAVYPQDWRPASGGGYIHTFTASFPVRIFRGERLSRLEVVATVREHRSRHVLAEPKNLRWDQIEERHQDVVVQWADATDPDYIRDHPIGPQEKSKTILQRLQGGSSVAVIAPRRFGKSTLAEFLVRESSQAGLAMIPAVWCTEFWSFSGFDYQRLWQRASNALKALLGAEIGSGRDGYLPTPEAFDHVRTVAQQKGFKAVVLLFDEAQLFFPAHSGRELSSQVKMYLERHWARSEKGKVPLLLAMVGLPSLYQRVGADLMGVFNPVAKASMDESELKPLIGHMVKGLQTTREARQRLATASGNLFVLRALLERLKDHVNEEHRRWASYGDVFDVEESLRRDLQRASPESETVAAYVRDILNDAERVEDWRPLAAFPVAVAIAQERQAGRTWAELEQRVTDVLNEWCALIADEEVRPTYDSQAVSEHVQALRERGVIRENEFSSRLLEAWLLGVASRTRFGLEEAFLEALLRGSQRRIRVPEGVTRVAIGGQAEIIRQDDKAYRVKTLASDLDRQHYLETVRVMERLKDVWDSREMGSNHVFEPIDIGLSAKNPNQAVQVYRWVEGQDLSGRQSAISQDAVVDIGLKLARAVSLLHKNNILHRDIAPRNIVVADTQGESLNPVLIDFGFARMAEGASATVLQSEHLAPEVRSAPALWSKAADVYGLASTLRWLLASPEKFDALRGVLERAMAEKPEARPDIGTFCVDLEGLSEGLHLEQRQEEAWREIRQCIARDRSSPWIEPLMRQSQSSLVAVTMGFSHDFVDRCRAVSDFLYKTTESCPNRAARLKSIATRLSGDDAKAIEYALALRHDRAHGGDVMFVDTKRVIDQFKTLEPKEQRRFVLLAAGRVGKATQFLSLEKLSILLLDGIR